MPLEEGGAKPGATWTFGLLGEMTLSRAGQCLSTPPHRTHSLLAFLLLRPTLRRRERQASLLFPDLSERRSRRRLSDTLWLLRASLPALPIQCSLTEVWLDPSERWLDVEAFQDSAAGPTLDDWQGALTLYEGELCPGLYDEWLLPERESLYLTYVHIALKAGQALLRKGRAEQAIPYLERLMAHEPYDERALRVLMRAYQTVGQRGAALAAYDRFQALADGELGVAPESATRALAEALRVRVMLTDDTARHQAPAAQTPATLLTQGCMALARGDWGLVTSCLERLRTKPGTNVQAMDGMRLLELDLALAQDDLTAAEGLLAEYGAEVSAQPGIRARAAELALARHEVRSAHDIATEALLLAHQTRDGAAELVALVVLAQAQQRLGRGTRAKRTAERALRLAQATPAPEGVVRAMVTLGFVECLQGHYQVAIATVREATTLADEHGLRYELGRGLHCLGQAQCNSNLLVAALETVQEELSIWRDLGLARREAEALEGLALIHDLSGRSDDSRRALQRAQAISLKLGDPLRLAVNQYHLACTLVYQDDTQAAQAIAYARQALAGFQAHHQQGRVAAALTILGYALWVAGQAADALPVLAEAVVACEATGEFNRLPELLAYQGLALLDTGDPVASLRRTEQAVLSMAQGEVSQEVVPDIYYAHAMSLQANDMTEEAQAHLARAYESLLDGAAEIDDEAARQAFFHRNPSTRRLMRELVAHALAPDPEAGTISQKVPVRRGGQVVRLRWTIDAGAADAALKKAHGAIILRRSRLSRLLREAKAQGVQPTVGQLAKALGVSERTVQRDLAAHRDDTGQS